MKMTLLEQIITIAIAAFGTILTRFLPFIIFTGKKRTPKFIEFLGQMLPPAILGMLVIYCYRDQLLHVNSQTLMAGVAGIITVIFQLWKKSSIWGIASGTISYILMISFW